MTIETRLQKDNSGGFSVSEIILHTETVQEIATLMKALKDSGIIISDGSLSGDKIETIACVVARVHVDDKGQETPVIDCYPAFRGDYGQFRFVSIYLNTPEDIAEFEAQSGIKLGQMTVYESQSPLQRNANRTHKCEMKTRPFRVSKEPKGEQEINGKMQMTYRFTGYVDAAVKPDERPDWWNEVYRQMIKHPYFHGVADHLINAMKKAQTEYKIGPNVATSNVIEIMHSLYDNKEPDKRKIS